MQLSVFCVFDCLTETPPLFLFPGLNAQQTFVKRRCMKAFELQKNSEGAMRDISGKL